MYDWLESVRADRQPVALFPPVLVGLTRIATNARIFVNPSPLATVTNFARALQTTPGFEVLPTTERVLAMTLALCEQTDAKGIWCKTRSWRPTPWNTAASGSRLIGTFPDSRI